MFERFVAQANIDHFRALIVEEADEGKRQILLRLLAEEEAALARVLAAEKQK